MRYDITLHGIGNTLLVSDTISGYTLHVDKTWGKSHAAKNVFFEVPASRNGFRGIVSCRDLEFYGPEVREVTDGCSQDKRYLEIGAGLGGFVQGLLTNGYQGTPTIIDPANYKVMLFLLGTALSYTDEEPIQARLFALKSRCKLYLSDKVNVVNTDFEQALNEFGQSFDVVVDNMGPCHWHSSLGYGTLEEVIELERQFLRKEGRLFVGINNSACTQRS